MNSNNFLQAKIILIEFSTITSCTMILIYKCKKKKKMMESFCTIKVFSSLKKLRFPPTSLRMFLYESELKLILRDHSFLRILFY